MKKILLLVLCVLLLASCSLLPNQQSSSTITISGDVHSSQSSEPSDASLNEVELHGIVEVLLAAIPLDVEKMETSSLSDEQLSMFAVSAYFNSSSPYYVDEESRNYIGDAVFIPSTMFQQIINEVFGISDYYSDFFEYDNTHDGYVMDGGGLPYFYYPINAEIVMGENNTVIYTCDYQEPAYDEEPEPPLGPYSLHFQLTEENGHSFFRFLYSEKVS